MVRPRAPLKYLQRRRYAFSAMLQRNSWSAQSWKFPHRISLSRCAILLHWASQDTNGHCVGERLQSVSIPVGRFVAQNPSKKLYVQMKTMSNHQTFTQPSHHRCRLFRFHLYWARLHKHRDESYSKVNIFGTHCNNNLLSFLVVRTNS